MAADFQVRQAAILTDVRDRFEKGTIGDLWESLGKLLAHYYDTVLRQSRSSFLLALIFTAIGVGLFFAAIILFLAGHPLDIALLTVISGGIVEAISGLNFVLYGKATDQLGVYHRRLDRVGRSLLGKKVCDSISDPKAKDECLAALAATLAAPDS